MKIFGPWGILFHCHPIIFSTIKNNVWMCYWMCSFTEPCNLLSVNLLEENRQLKDSRTCKVCMDQEVNTVFLLCGHLVCCNNCAPELRNCAICRSLIRGTVRIFWYLCRDRHYDCSATTLTTLTTSTTLVH